METDHTLAISVASNMRDAVQKMHDMSSDVGAAKQVEKFTSKRLDNLLSKYIEKTMVLDSRLKPVPMSTREHQARVMPDYQTEFEQIAQQHKEALILIQQYDAHEKRYEAARSLLSFSKHVRNDHAY
jgi:hypothetical protein